MYQATSEAPELRAPLHIDPLIVLLTTVLVLFGMMMIYSTTGVTSEDKFGDTLFFVKRQGFAVGLGIILFIVAQRIPITLLRKISPLLLPLCVGLLALTLIPGIGLSGGGARRWIVLGSLRFQPAELVKVLFVIFIAGFCSRHETRLREFAQGIVKPLVIVGVIAGLLLIQPDFGSAVVVSTVTLGMLAVSGVRVLHLAYSALAMLIAASALVISSPYRMSRILTFLTPWQDESGKGYQLIQSLTAVSIGEIFGSGLGAGKQKLFYLPAAHTDFIFAVIGEELGFVGSVAVVLTFIAFLWRGLKLASRMIDDTFVCSLLVGLTLLIVLPAMINFGVVLGLLPTKGLVLPLVGYGGSSMVVSLFAVGLLLSVSRQGMANRHALK